MITPTKPRKVLVLGSGGLRIGQAGEFDYSGSQALKALKEEEIVTVLINPNMATVQTDPNMADEVYFQPLNLETVSQVIEKEKPDGILVGFAGQTGLNLALELQANGLLERMTVRVLGTPLESIRSSEDRDLFKSSLAQIAIKTPISFSVSTVEEALSAAEKIGYPLMLRAGFSLGGLGSGKIDSPQRLKDQAQASLSFSPQILIEEYLLGWKEFEYEVIRDRLGQALTVCSMENMDPMGIHTGDSIVVAPAQTLTSTDHQDLRDRALKIAEHFGIIGECNVQFAVNPQNGDYRVIEMNARLSRSSALASKATGYPLAFVAAKLALGYTLSALKNNVTQKTYAFFEPSLDYIVVKIPRWDTHKLKAVERRIGTEMKSVGEVMAIGRSFPEALQKAVDMLNLNFLGHYEQTLAEAKEEVQYATDKRLFALYNLFKEGISLEEVHQLSWIDPWFLFQIKTIADIEKQISNQPLSKEIVRLAKEFGFSDKVFANLKALPESEIRSFRLKHNIIPYIKQIDTLAGEFDAETNYLYLTYQACEHDVSPELVPPILILGSGPYAIGSSVEFDWCGVNMARTLRVWHKTTVFINSNPETVSTDFDESDRLYFEPLTLERVQDIADFEHPEGIVVCVGGQVANNLALPLAMAGYPLLGTDPWSIDRAEDREKFSALLTQLGIEQPAWKRVSTGAGARVFAEAVGYPVLIRPSYILSGSAMNVAYRPDELEDYLQAAKYFSPDHPVVISKFIVDSKELEIDGVAQNGEIVIQAISEHVENAGVHSGDATIVLPPQNLYLETIRRTKKIASMIVKALNVTGPFNIQFLAKDNAIQVIECNMRASRSFPFVSKVIAHNLVAIATQVLLGKYKPRNYETLELDYVGVKAAQFSFSRLKGVNPVAHVEMASTGEVACLADDFLEAFYKAWLATDQIILEKSILVSIAGDYKAKLLDYIRALDEQEWKIYTTEGSHRFYTQQGLASYFVYKASEPGEPNIRTLIEKRKVSLIVNIPGKQRNSIQKTDGSWIRQMAIQHHIPLITNAQSAKFLLQALVAFFGRRLSIHSWGEFVKNRKLLYEKDQI